jgi:hypothetical protein
MDSWGGDVGDGDATRGDDGTGGRPPTGGGDGDRTRGDDGTGGGDNSYIAPAPAPDYGGGGGGDWSDDGGGSDG